MQINGIELSKEQEEVISGMIAYRLKDANRNRMLMKSIRRKDIVEIRDKEIELLKGIQEAIGYAKDVGSDYYSKCKECEHGVLVGQLGGGVKCTECNYWFCY